jgi:undecaprenyl diphosphate synthase
MSAKTKMKRIPKHIGIIPDGNRRWAEKRDLPKERGYDAGLAPGLAVFRLCKDLGVKELTFYGFTQDNTKRPREQTVAFQKACVDAVKLLSKEDADLLVIGNSKSPMFPRELLPYTKRTAFGSGGIRLNFLVNYGWLWDLEHALNLPGTNSGGFMDCIHSSDISRVDLIIRWGGRRRLSGFLPVQSVYSDFYIIESYWPDFKPEHFYEAISWYEHQDITLGG